MSIIVDADALIVLADSEHEKHERGKMIFDNILQYHKECIYPMTAICEAVTVLQKPLKKAKAAQFLIEMLKEGVLPTIYVNEETFSESLAIYSEFDIEKRSGDTLFD